jgi:crotonobetainyl-CoA:carnitine CoA-transferase CaiB-like acyl-CoA transferase
MLRPLPDEGRTPPRGRLHRVQVLGRRLAAATRRRTFKEWTRRLESLDVCVTPVATLAEAVQTELRLEKGRGVFRRGRDGRYEIVPRIR